jgi:hypothetical protein
MAVTSHAQSFCLFTDMPVNFLSRLANIVNFSASIIFRPDFMNLDDPIEIQIRNGNIKHVRNRGYRNNGGYAAAHGITEILFTFLMATK